MKVVPLQKPFLKFYPYQKSDIDQLIAKIKEQPKSKILYQLPTGGGKTVVFCELVRQFLETSNEKALVLTHRKELCQQTFNAMKKAGVLSKKVDSSVKKIRLNDSNRCYTAMVETLKNRINDKAFPVENIGLIIIDEAHHNSFQKLIKKFVNATVIGVTATPLSSDKDFPMHKTYQELIEGKNIASLIEDGYLARPKVWRYDVELNSLKTGIHGDYTVSSSDALYSTPAMLQLLLDSYEKHVKGKKTIIFNTGIFTSKAVCDYFSEAGYTIRHLDHRTPNSERDATLKWFRKTKSAILTSVSLLTTGFDEPGIQAVILNRATNSLTLYHQMMGRGSRRLPKKKTFNLIDLGNNIERFGRWDDPLDWSFIFKNPDRFLEHQASSAKQASTFITPEIRLRFPNTLEFGFDVQAAHHTAVEAGEKSKTVIRDSIRQHAMMCVENASTQSEALELCDLLQHEIEWRVKQYAKCLENVSKNYVSWLLEDYVAQLRKLVVRIMTKRLRMSQSA